MSNPDPGGGGPPDLTSIQDNFSQQQAKISALKELVRQSEATQGRNNASAQEKAKNIALRLTHLKTNSARSRRADKSLSEVHEEHPPIVQDASIEDDRSDAEVAGAESLPPALNRSRSETPGSEKIQLLRRQMEQNRAKMAEREHSKRDIEQLVTQLKAKFDNSQMSLDRSQQLGRSIGDLSATASPHAHKYQSASDLSGPGGHNFDKDRIRYLEKRLHDLEQQLKHKDEEFLGRDAESENANRCKQLENSVLDLQEQLREKDSVIEARTQAVGLLSENMSMKGKNTVDLLEDTQQEMLQMQQRFVDVEASYRSDIEQKAARIENLEEVNDILETARFDLTVKMAQLEDPDHGTKFIELQKINETLQRRINELEESKLSDGDSNIPNKDLEELKIKLKNAELSIKKFEEQLEGVESDEVSSDSDKQIAELNHRISELQVENDDLKRSLQSPIEPITNDDLSDHIRSLEAELFHQKNHNSTLSSTIESLESDLQEKTIDLNVLSANFSVLQEKLKSSAPKSLFSVSTDEEAEAEVAKLKSQLDEANKSAIKTKLKTKQLQKQIDALKKTSDLAAKVCQLTQDNENLNQRVQELEELAANSTSVPSDSDLGQRIQVLETTCHNQISAIRLLEEQKIDISQDLSTAKEELHTLQDHCKSIDDHDETVRVQSHMESIEKEETIETSLLTIAHLRTEVAALQAERSVLLLKLDENAAENMELAERWDKMNKNSSAESIEIVENLTPQETLEMEEMQRAVDGRRNDDSAPTISEDLNDSLVKLREESSELMQKIEMFTTERKEVLEKMDVLTTENIRLQTEVEQLQTTKADLEREHDEKILHIKTQLDTVEQERSELLVTIKELQTNKLELREELNMVTKSRADATFEAIEYQPESYEKSIKSLEALLESYRRGKDKNAKFDVSKKLAKEAKNLVDQMTKLLTDHGQTVERFNELRMESAQSSQLESLKDSSRNERIEAELVDATNSIQQLETECAARKEEVTKLMEQIEEQSKSREEVNTLNQSIRTLDAEIESLKLNLDNLTSDRDTLRKQNETLTNRIKENEQEQLDNSNHESLIEKLRHENELLTQNTEERMQKQKHDFERRFEAAEQERTILQTLIDEQKAQLIQSITEYQDELDSKSVEIEELQRKLKSSETAANQDHYIEELNDKMVALKQLFDENNDQLEQQANELVNKQETIATLNAQIMELYRNTEDHSTSMLEKDDEINFLQEIIDGNRGEMKTLNQKITNLEAQIERLQHDLNEKLKTINVMENKSTGLAENEIKIAELQKIIHDLEDKNKEQLDKLKKFAANLKKKNAQCMELSEKIDHLEAADKESHTSNPDDLSQIEALTKELNHKSITLMNYQQTIQEMSDQLNQVHREQAQMAETLQQSSSNAEQLLEAAQQRDKVVGQNRELSQKLGSLEQDLQSAETRNLELVNRAQELEQFCANLNGKVSCMDEMVQSLEVRTAELNALRQTQSAQSEELASQKIKIEKCKVIIRDKNREIKKLQESVAEMSERTVETSGAGTRNQELELDMEALRQQEEQHQLKLQEHVNYIESLQVEGSALKEKISQLEEHVGGTQKQRDHLEHELFETKTQLSVNNEQFQRSQEELQGELNQSMENLKETQKKLKVIESQRQELQDNLREAKETITSISQKHNSFESQVTELERQLNQAEDDKAILIRDNNQLQADMKREFVEFERKLSEKRDEVDTLENDLTVQLQRIEDERRRLHESLDKSVDENGELQSDIVRFKEIITSLEQSNSDLEREMTWIKLQNESLQHDQIEVQELRMQIVHDQTELENLKTQVQSMAANHETEVSTLKQQLAELDSLRTQIGQNQTDDQMFIQNENERLQALLATKEAEIQNYQRQNLQLQMTGAFSRPDPFAAFAGPSQPPQTMDDFARLTSETSSDSEKLERIQDLELRLQRTANELQLLKSQHDESVRTSNAEKHQTEANYSLQVQTIETELAVLRNQSEEAVAAKEAEIQQLQDLIQNMEHEQQRSSAHEIIPQEAPVKAINFNEFMAQPSTSTSDPAVGAQEMEKNRLLTSQMEQYINDLQIQLRIATNDNEQLTQMQQSLEDEIQQSSRNYEHKINALREELQNRPVEPSVVESIESQIIPSGQQPAGVVSFDGSMFFGHTSASAFDFPKAVHTVDSAIEPQREVVEEVIVAKKAYQCIEDDTNQTEDAWGFGSDEAALEEQHRQQTIPTSSSSLLTTQGTLELQLQVQEDKIQELTLERDRLRADNQAMQVKSGKMLKKLKEYKSKNDELNSATQKHFSKSPSVESNELDMAIQDELNSQIKTLESRLAAMKIDQDKDQVERQSLLKRVDVLTSANERLTEMKERQDNEMEGCKLKVRELSQKLAQLEEWSDDNYASKPTSETKASPQELEDLNRQIADLRVDNDELQAILDEEKETSRSLEDKLSKFQESSNLSEELQTEHNATVTQLTKLQEESRKLSDEIEQKNQQIQYQEQRITQLVGRMNESVATIDTLSVESNNIRLHLDQLKLDHQVKIDENSSLSQQLKAFSDHIKEMQHSMSEVPRSTKTDDSSVMEKQLEELQATLQCKDAEIVHLNQTVADAVSQDQTASLVQEILTKNTEIESLRSQIADMKEQNDDLLKNVSAQLTKELEATKVPASEELIKKLEHEVSELRKENQNMEQELQVLNDQVMSSLGLEDEMNAIQLQMDTKNIEITELKSSLAQMTSTSPPSTTCENVDEITKQLNDHWQQVLDERCSEVAESWRQHLNTREQEFESEKLTIMQQATPSTIVASTAPRDTKLPSDVAEAQLESMQAVLETQEMEIVTLKEQLAIRSAEYARIAAQVDPFGQLATSNSLSVEKTRRDDARSTQKSELDLALYMLHQRDMRCEELTEELMSMLEERDSLQMKLATSIRQLERQRLASGSGFEVTGGDLQSTDTTPEKNVTDSKPDDATDAISPVPFLTPSASSSRTKSLRDEREQRQRQMSILQRDVATLPAEAVAELMGPDYNSAAARSTVESSPSSALLNWFWGKSSEDR